MTHIRALLGIVLSFIPVVFGPVLFGPVLLGQPEPGQAASWELRGVVRTSNGPVKNLFVNLSGPEPVRPARTDAEGRFAFSGKEPGQYVVSVSKTEDIAEPRSRTIRISSGQKLEGIQFLIARGASVSGKLVDTEKRPVGGMTVAAYLKTSFQGKLRLEMKGGSRTDADGLYRIRNLAGGSYVIAAVPGLGKPLAFSTKATAVPETLPAPYPAMTFAPGTRDLSSAVAVVLQAGETRETVDIRLEKHRAFCLWFGANAALPPQARRPELRVTIKEWIGLDGATIAEGAIASGEEHQLCGLAEGEYRLHYVTFQKDPIEGIGYGKQSAMLSKQHLRLPIAPVPVAGEISGRVFVRDAPKEKPLPSGIEVRLIRGDRPLLPNDGFSARPASTDGLFQIQRVYIDGYGVEIRNLPRGYFVRNATQAGRDALAGGELTPGAGEVSIELSATGASVSGRVNSEDGKPFADATVILGKSGDEARWTTVSDQYGAFEFPQGFAEGTYRIAAVDLPSDFQRRDSQSLSKFLERGLELKLSPSEAKLVDVKLLASQ